MPDYKNTFIKTIEEMNLNSQMRLIYKEAIGFPSDSVIQVKVRIKKIEWIFHFSTAVMETHLIYELPNEKINITGSNKVYFGGSKKGNLYKSILDGNYLFLSGFCNN